MAPPDLTVNQVASIIPEASDISELDRGGQKIVFVGVLEGEQYVFKFMSPNLSQTSTQDSDFIDDVTARAQREVETMQQCNTPHLVRMGPIGLSTADIDEKPIIYFSEELIEGKNLGQYYAENGNFSIGELISLAQQISEAISSLWQFFKIHRDIKPGNIMRRESNGEFVLLDFGLA